ncbi:MAG: hypothetical protein AABZ36_01395 [Nitrospirota bacterium]
MKGPNQVLDRIKMGRVHFPTQILSAKQQPPSSLFSKGELSNADTSTFEHQIYEMVYDLYDPANPQAGLRRKKLRLWMGKGKINKKGGHYGSD